MTLHIEPLENETPQATGIRQRKLKERNLRRSRIKHRQWKWYDRSSSASVANKKR